MDITKMIAVGFLTAVMALILREVKPELSFAVTLAGTLLLLYFAIAPIQTLSAYVQSVVKRVGVDEVLIKALLKMIGVGYLVQFAAGLLTDFGFSGMAEKLVFCGRLAVLVLSLPILNAMLSLLGELVELVG